MSEPIAELDVVVLTRDIPDEGIVAGDRGVVLLAHAGHDDVPPGFTVEVVTPQGETVGVVDVPADWVSRRP